ncbi:MAG: hypothetical protein H7832_12475 [Magnetococcus sp. DMHC-6]
MIFHRYKISNRQGISLAIFFLLTWGTISWMVNVQIKKQVMSEAEEIANLLLDRHLTIYHFFTYQLPEILNSNHKDISNQTIINESINKINGYFKGLHSKRGRFLYDRSIVKVHDHKDIGEELDQMIMDRLNRDSNATNYSELRILNGKPNFYLMRRNPGYREDCESCHNSNKVDSKIEKSTAAKTKNTSDFISIQIPLGDAFWQGDKKSLEISAFLFIIFSMLYIIQLSIVNFFLLHPLALLRTQMLKIINEKLYSGEQVPLPMGEELEDFANAFNRFSYIFGKEWNAESKNRALTQHLLEITNQGMAILDLQGHLLGFNHYFINQHKDKHALPGRLIGDILPLSEDNNWKNLLERILRDGQPIYAVLEGFRLFPVMDEEGNIFRFIICMNTTNDEQQINIRNEISELTLKNNILLQHEIQQREKLEQEIRHMHEEFGKRLGVKESELNYLKTKWKAEKNLLRSQRDEVANKIREWRELKKNEPIS